MNILPMIVIIVRKVEKKKKILKKNLQIVKNIKNCTTV